MANKHMKRCSTSCIKAEMQIKISIRYHWASLVAQMLKNLLAMQKTQV